MMDLYAEADFAGLWNAEDPNDPICTKVKIRYIIDSRKCATSVEVQTSNRNRPEYHGE